MTKKQASLETKVAKVTQEFPTEIIDRENAFLLYATFCGDCVRTAHALNVQPDTVARAAAAGGWNEKLSPILALKQSTKPGDVERAMNRALNFVQAHQMRMFVARVLRRLSGMSEKELEDYVMSVESTAKGFTHKITTRAIADLASAMEKCQAMSYQALNDTTTERVKREENIVDVSAGDMHARIAAAMAEVRADNSPRAKLLDAQLEEAARLKEALRNA